MSDALSVILVLISILLGILVLWVVPIWLGLRMARERHRAAAWMWFAIHPLGGWITFAVLASLPSLKTCPECAEKAKAAARRCPHCHQPFPA